MKFQPIIQIVQPDAIVRCCWLIRQPVCAEFTLSVSIRVIVGFDRRVARLNRSAISLRPGLLLYPAFKLGIGGMLFPDEFSDCFRDGPPYLLRGRAYPPHRFRTSVIQGIGIGVLPMF
jgi:hypothetical protein